MLVNLLTTQKVMLHAKPKNELGEDVVGFVGPFVWAVSDNAFGTLAPSEDGFHCEFVTSGVAGDCMVTATFEALVGTVDLHITVAPAVAVEMTADAPVVK